MSATGTSVNPARSIGVGVFAGADAIVQLWLFVLAPLLGAAIAGLTYPILFGQGAAPVAGSGLSFGGGRKDQFVPGSYEAQWNQGQQGSWGQPGAAWGAPPQQQWGQPEPYQQQPQQPQQPQPPTQPGQWGQPEPYQQPQQPQQQPQQPGQWGAPGQTQQPGQPGAPGHWGNPDGDDDGRTQVRRPD
jgi:aquaporin Z